MLVLVEAITHLIKLKNQQKGKNALLTEIHWYPLVFLVLSFLSELYLQHVGCCYLHLGSQQVGMKKQRDEPLSKLVFVLPLNMYNDSGMIICKMIISSSGLK